MFQGAGGKMTEGDYRAWRQRFPWTDAQIAAALDAEAASAPSEFMARRSISAAAWVRAGHLNRSILSFVLPRLITTCALCGHKALYRYGNEGRCRAHKLARPMFFKEKCSRLDCASALRERNNKAFDGADRYRRVLHTVKSRRP